MRTGDTNEQCENCRFWAPKSAQEVKGECRRRAPDHKGWAKTRSSDFCGEFEYLNFERVYPEFDKHDDHDDHSHHHHDAECRDASCIHLDRHKKS